MALHGVRIAGTGGYVPDRVLTNHDLEKMVDTSDEWIVTRTGIRERRIAAPDQATSDMAAEAARRALDNAGASPEDVELIVVATLSADHYFPNTACYVQKKIGARTVPSFSLEAAGCGFLYGLDAAVNMVRAGGYGNALVIGAEKLSMHVNWEDRATCVLFGDGAGAVFLERTTPEKDAYLGSCLGADGTYTDLLIVPAGGSAQPITHQLLDEKKNTIHMMGRETFKLAVNAMVNAARTALKNAGVGIEEIRWLVPHQANQRIISAVGQRLGIPAEQVYVNLDRYGNTSAASIPLALGEIAAAGKIAPGDKLLFVAFGGGLTWAASVIEWQA